MVNFADKLLEAIDRTQNPSVIGLDPVIENIPAHIRQSAWNTHGGNREAKTAEAIRRFNFDLIDALADIVPAVKPNAAFYEALGPHGINVLEKTRDYAQQKRMVVILDGKRNDIGNTAEMYGRAHLGQARLLDGSNEGAGVSTTTNPRFDALTVNAYLGSDGVTPFVKECKEHDKGIFVLVKTSNKSSGEIQDLVTNDGERVYEKMARLVDKWGKELAGKRGYSSIGAVVGATFPEEAEKIRKLLPRAIILVPGYGAQGGGAKDTMHCFNSDGYGAIVNSSRGVIFAYQAEKYRCDGKEFALAAQKAAVDMRNDLQFAMSTANKLPKGWPAWQP